MTKPYSFSVPLRLDAVTDWDIETEVAIVGFGIAGACAAIEAHDAGAKVTLFELASVSGGSSALSGGEFYLGGNGGTPVQRTAGFEDSTENFYKYLMMAGGPKADEARVRCYAEGACTHFDWLVAQGIPFKGTYLPGKSIEPTTDDTLLWSGSEDAWPFSWRVKPVPRGHTAQAGSVDSGTREGSLRSGWLVMEKLTERVNALGIDTRFGARALALVADADNRVHGLVVRIDGKPHVVRASKGVILCTGGFICNEEMIRHYAPEVRRCPGPTTAGNDHGAGILLGASVGAATIHMGEFFATRPMFARTVALRHPRQRTRATLHQRRCLSCV